MISTAKRYGLVCLCLVMVLIAMTSCEEKEIRFLPPAPSLLPDGFTSSSQVQEAGRSIELSYTLEAAAGLDQLTVMLNDSPFENIVFIRNEFTSQYNLSYTISEDATVGTVLRFVFSLFDKQGRKAEYTYTLTVGLTYEEEETVVGGETVTRLKGRINGDYLFSAEKKYLIDSVFSIEDNGVLTIEAGTTVYFKTSPTPQYISSLYITRGSRINAVGEKDAPIIFTSDKVLTGDTPSPQDWGGIYLYGNAPTNQGASVLENGFRYGGTATGENSGTLKFIRIEYSGKGGAHGLHLFGVGAGTIIENIQVYRSYNIAFRLKGGNVRLKRIAATGYGAYGIWAEHGWRGLGQFWIFHTDVKATLVPINYWNQARALEMRNDESQFLRTPRTEFQIANVTATGNGFEEGVDNGTRRGVRIRRGAIGVLQNMIVTAFPDDAVRVEDLDIAELGNRMVMANQRTYNNRVDFNNEALTFFFESGSFNITQTPVPGISVTNFVGSVTSSFNPTTLGSWFEPAPYIGAVENEANDWTADGTWFKNLDGSIR